MSGFRRSAIAGPGSILACLLVMSCGGSTSDESARKGNGGGGSGGTEAANTGGGIGAIGGGGTGGTISASGGSAGSSSGGSGECVPEPWSITTVDADGDTGHGSSIAVDASGAVHISYVDDTAHALRFASRDPGGTWTTSTVDSTKTITANGTGRTSLTVDASGGVHVSYDYTLSSGGLGYVFRAAPGASWTTSPVDSLGGDSSIAVDTSGGAHIAYIYFSGWYLRYAYKSASGTWTTDDLKAVYYRYPSLALDKSGGVHVAYNDDSTLMYTSLGPNGSWTTSTVDSLSTSFAPKMGLAVDSLGGVHISYSHTEDTDGLRYAHRDPAGAWTTTTIDSSPDFYTGFASSLAVDPQRGVHVTYAQLDPNNGSPQGNLRYAYRSPDGVWTTATLDTVSYLVNIGNPSLAVDALGGVHVSYYGTGDLRYAYSRRCP